MLGSQHYSRFVRNGASAAATDAASTERKGAEEESPLPAEIDQAVAFTILVTQSTVLTTL